ncbi:MAG TPA: XdhC family protein [Thermoanaerobaculia bacterium]|jgi:xanthine dehydrogenase accessory factor|nr:XdhC family protein [Thermoanaerobaculia bacterium]
MSHETFELIDRLRRSGQRAAMATLVRTAGTTPRKEGTKMFVGQDGGIFGSITIGGCVDARVIEQAGAVLDAGGARLLKMDLGDEEAWEIGLTCGGSVDVLLEPLGDDLLHLYQTARQEWNAGRSVAVATVLDTGAHLLIESGGTVHGSAPADLLDLLRTRLPRRSCTLTLGGHEVYVEVLRPPSRLCVFGAGAVAIPLVGFAKELGFRTILIDGRARFASRERFPHVDEIKLGIASEIAGQLGLGDSTPVVLAAHDYKIDVPVLEQALATDAPYIGLLGSRRRGAAILQLLRENGVAEEQLRRVRVPVGLDLGGETAAEIALAIIAEVVAVMRGRSGGPMSART